MARKVQGGYSTPVSIESIDLAGGAGARIPVDANLQVGDVDVAAGNPVPVDLVAGIAAETLRDSVTDSVTFLAGTFQTDPFDMQAYGGGNVYIPAAWTNADIGFKVAPTVGGTYMILYDDNGNIVQATVGATDTECHSFPPEVYACRFVRLWSQLLGVNVLQVAERDMIYELKS